ncbi:MAG: type II toxin-antitoxin system VapB family antitoxin [Syntrophales bacterium LBB04]|nr:type II toxin-antitoxin system VapB family antitoxin [Syntrophales bacterium LBB04]
MRFICCQNHVRRRTTLLVVESQTEQKIICAKTTLVKLGLEALIARESARRLAKLGGTEKGLKDVPRGR